MIKPRFDLISPVFMEYVALVFTHGRQKYPNQALTDVPIDATLQSLLRHANELHQGKYINTADFGLPVESHIAARAMMHWLVRTKDDVAFDEAVWLERVRDEK
jgi:hypothetical protein